MIKIEAYQVGEQINLKKFKAEFAAITSSSAIGELFYAEEGRYVYLLSYGVVIFAGYDDVRKSDFLRFLQSYIEEKTAKDFMEDFCIEYDESVSKPVFRHNSIAVNQLNEGVIKNVMLNVGQSVALDYYEHLTYRMLSNVKVYTDELESYGKLKVSKKNLLKFIGKTLNVKNSIIDNLYILDNPGSVWDNEHLEYVNKGMKDLFDIHLRFRDLDYKLRGIEDSLKLFTDLLQNKESHRLEWIIIILIFIEVINLLWREIF
jgi:required for meiotic nuclear division protein 1